jgi:hypothetical protein
LINVEKKDERRQKKDEKWTILPMETAGMKRTITGERDAARFS